MTLAMKLGVLSSANILVQFLFQWYLLTTLGASLQTDALFAGLILPQIFLTVVSGSLTYVLIPLLSNLSSEKFQTVSWSILQIIAFLFCLLAILLGATASSWVPFVFPDFSEKGILLTVELTRIQLIGMFFNSLTTVLWSVSHARKRFLWVELSSILSNIISFGILLYFLEEFGIKVAAYAYVIKTFLQFIILTPTLDRYTKPTLVNYSILKAYKKIKPLLIGNTYYKSEQLVDRILSSMAPVGGLSLYYLSQNISTAINTVLNKSIATPLVPELSNLSNDNEWKKFRKAYLKRLWILVIVCTTIVFAIYVIGKPSLQFVLGWGNFGAADVNKLWYILLCMSGLIISGPIGQVLSNSFYSQGNTKIPTTIGVVGYTIGIFMKIIGFKIFGLLGLALGTSTYYLINSIVLFLFLEKIVRKKEGVTNEY